MSQPITAGSVRRRSKIYQLSMTAVMTAVTCVLAPMSIPIGVVPVSFTNFAIYLSLYLLGWKLGTVSYVVYMLIGMVGMPVFSGYSGGLAKLAGPTGGYIIGFIPLAILAGLVIEKCDNRVLQFLAMAVGTAVCYAFGTAWYCFSTNVELSYALGVCVFPFIPFDLVKMAIAMVVGPMIRSRLVKARLMD